MIRPMIRPALFAVLALATGCSTEKDPSSGSEVPTYYGGVGAILNQSCVGCHTTGGIGGFSLASYADAQPLAGLIKTYTAARIMPPFNADNSGSCNTFQHARWLSDEQISLLGAWSDAGAPEGDLSALPTPTPLASITSPDATVEMKADYIPVSGPNDDYRCFVLDSPTAADAFVTAFEFVPGDLRVVHHGILYATDSAGEAAALAMEDADPETGYDCYGGTGLTKSDWLAAWVPGAGATILPAGTGIAVEGGRKLVMQVHYNTAQGVFPDRTAVKLTLAPSVDRQAFLPRFSDVDMVVPPGEVEAVTTASFSLPDLGTIQLHAIGPHMHSLGTKFRAEYEKDGATTCLVDVPRWDFGWQQLFFYETPLTLQTGGTLRISCTYNTTGVTEPTTWGEDTDEEMCLALVYATAAP